jgi:NTP pyrophosphatase (non-canonical NTP hydrolase)
MKIPEDFRIADYSKLALRTEGPHESSLDVKIHRILHASLGLCSEFSELNESNCDYNEELGDLSWYVNLAASALGSTFDDLAHESFEADMDSVVNIGSCAGHIADKVKRSIFYGAELDEDYILIQLCQIKAEIFQLCEDSSLSVEGVLEANIRKLASRYPNKFSKDNALNRDLEKEKEALS